MRITSVEAELFHSYIEENQYDLIKWVTEWKQVDQKQARAYIDKLLKKLSEGKTDGRQWVVGVRKNDTSLKGRLIKDILKTK